jgi:transcriptional regulator with XRE-family HTH domain
MAASKHHQDMPEGRRREIARRIAEAREDLGMTQSDLAHQIGSYHSTISRYETGERLPSARYLRGLALALARPIPYLRASDWDEEGDDGEG